MSDVLSIEARTKSQAGTGSARALRREGQVPAIVYGQGAEPMMISIARRVLDRELNKPTFFSHLYDLKVDGQSYRVIAREVQKHPVTDFAMHIDFLRVSADTRIEVAVPVNFINEDAAPGIRRGGLLNVVRHEVDLICSADNIPESITVDLKGLQIGDSVHISAVTLPEGVVPTITDRDFTIATIAAPTVVSEEATQEEETAVAEAEAEEEQEAAEEAEGEAGEERE